MSDIRAGVGRELLRPPSGIAMAGYGRRLGRSTGVHDNIAAQALVLDDGATRVAIVGVDVLAFGLRLADQIARRVEERSGIPALNILIAATHTHSGPLFNIHATPGPGAKPSEDRDLEWERQLPDRIA